MPHTLRRLVSLALRTIPFGEVEHAPSLDDVFLNKTGRSLEGAGDEASAEQDTGEHAREAVPA